MNQTEAESVKDLARPVVEVLGMITERKCSECKGRGTYIDVLPNHPKDSYWNRPIYCPKCNGTGKEQWKWEPKVGEWFLDDTENVCLIYCFDNYHQSTQIYYVKNEAQNRYVVFQGKFTIPILHWEEIERVLEEVAYRPVVQAKWVGGDCYCYILKDENLVGKVIDANTRQEAVMKAVIALGKEMK